MSFEDTIRELVRAELKPLVQLVGQLAAKTPAAPARALMTAAEVQKHLGPSADWVSRRLRDGRLKRYGLKPARVRPEDVLALLEREAAAPRKDAAAVNVVDLAARLEGRR